MRVATIDIGTNTVLLLVATRGPDGQLQAIAERANITRLGEGVDRTRQLSKAAIERTTKCLSEYALLVRQLDVDRIGIVGTSAMRDASGGDAIRSAVRGFFATDARILTGPEEARLTFRGALGGLRSTSTESAVFDIGGGSTEVVVGRAGDAPELSVVESFDVGSVRLTERYGEDRDAITQAANGAFSNLRPLSNAIVPIGIAGTMTTLAAVSLRLSPYDGARVHGLQMSRTKLAEVVAALARLDVRERRNVPGMEPKRADVIVAGGLLALALLERWEASAVQISDRGVRWGLAEELSGL